MCLVFGFETIIPTSIASDWNFAKKWLVELAILKCLDGMPRDACALQWNEILIKLVVNYHSFRNHYILNSKTIKSCNCNRREF